MFNNQLLKNTTIMHFFTATGIAILIYIYAVAQGFTLPLQFQSEPEAQILSAQEIKPTPSTSSGPTATPHNSNPSHSSHSSNPSVLLTPTNSVLPAAAELHASERAQEVANVPEHAIENTQKTISKTVEKVNENIQIIIK